MRITFITPPPDLSGGQRVIATYADRLRRRGHRVVVVAPPPRRPRVVETVRAVLRGRPRPQYQSGSHLVGAGVEVRLLDRHRPVVAADVPDADVVIATWWETAEWVTAFPPAKGGKVYFLQHYEAFAHTPSDRVDATWRLPLRKITVAAWLAELGRDRFGDPHIPVVPNAADQGQFSAPPRGKQRVPTVGLMYSTVAFKGCDISLEAYRQASDHAPGLRLRTFGSPVDPRLPLPDGAEHVCYPAQDRISKIYDCCDVWMFGSRSEGFGLPILEAMACRTPVIGTPAGAAPELLAGGGGILVKPEDPADMAEAIVRVCRMPEAEWRAMSDAAYATATSYTWDDATDRFESALFAAAGRPPPAPQPGTPCPPTSPRT